MKKRLAGKIIRTILIAALLGLTVYSVSLRYLIPLETQIGWLVDYDEVIFHSDGRGSYFLKRDENTVSYVNIHRRKLLCFTIGLEVLTQADFNLETRTLDYEKWWMKNNGIWPNEFAQEARKLYAWQGFITNSNFLNHSGDLLANFYVGISDTEPVLENLGDGVHDLQYAEVADGLYAFMFTQDV